MEVSKSKLHSFIKHKLLVKVFASLVCLSLLIGLGWTIFGNPMRVTAKQDTLPGIVKIQNQYLGSSESFKILELQPTIDAAEIGFYIGGQEPFPSLIKQDGTIEKWQQILATLETKEDRIRYMNSLEEEARNIATLLQGGIFALSSPFYEEVEASSVFDAQERGYSYIEYPGESFRGYFLENNGNGQWNVSFQALEDTNIALDDINLGKDTPYYRAFYDANTPLTKEEIESLASNAPNTYLYQNANGVLVLAGTVSSIWDSLKVNFEDNSQEGNVEDEQAMVIPAFYNPSFALINGVEENYVTAGDGVYTVSPRNAIKVEMGGRYTLVSTVEGEQAGANYKTPSTYVYYKGGVQNSEYFKNKVLGLEASEYASFKAEVTTVTVETLNQMSMEEIATFDMVYIGSGTLKRNVLEPGWNEYTYTTDINQGVMDSLADLIVTKKIPCILDGSLVLDNNGIGVWYSFADTKISNLEKLLAMLISPVKEKVYAEGKWSNRFLRLTDANNVENYLPISEIVSIDASEDENAPHDASYVQKNIWVYSFDDKNFIRNNFGQEDYEQTNILSGGFDAVLKEIQSENKIRNQYGNPLLNEEIHDFSVWRYIVNYQNQREEVIKSSLRVLKIEPATNSDLIFVGNHSTTMKEYLSDITGVAMENITVDSMPITQFIGMIDDLNTTYDMVYIGSLMDNLHTNSEGTSTVYNDTNMNGLLYSHVGDLMLESFHVSGLLNTDFTTRRGSKVLRMNSLHRYSGNDITPEKFNALMDFVDAAYPVVLAKDLLEEDENGECIRVDDSSYLYEFLDMTRETKNVLTIDEIVNAESDFSFYLNRPKMKIENLQILNAGDFATNSEIKVIDKVGGVYTLSYRFIINYEGAISPNDLYQCKLFFDANADGKFSRINEEILGITIKDASGNVVGNNQLKAGELYYLDCIVSDNYRGCMTWQLELQQTDNPMIRSDEKGYVKINAIELQPVRISILQVYFHSSQAGNLILENDIGPVEYDASTKHWKYSSPNGVGHFGTYSRGMQSEYVLDVTSISRAEFEQFVSTGSVWHNGKEITTLEDYDMLIVGFSDAFDIYYSGVDWSEAAAKKVVEFAETGKSVLLSHDTTSLITVPPEYMNISNRIYKTEEGDRYIDDSVWGYTFNKYVRNTLGMDMYGVTVSDTLQKGEVLKDYRTDEDSSNDYQTKDWIVNNSFKANPTTRRYEYFNFRDLAYAPRSNRTETVAQTQGISYTLLNKRTADSGLLFYRKGLGQYSDHYSQTISKNNEGQITNYPYKIEDEFLVGRTHSQYYTLNMSSDMNEDMQTDLVVWYTLEGSQYGSIKDVRNNYYIYSIGNVMYTGMGHGSSTESAQLTHMEAMLFMNTIIASYKAGIQSPNVNLDDGSADTYIYNFLEPDLESAYSEPVEVECAFRDLNVLSGTKEIEVQYYIEDAINGTSMNGMDTKVSRILDAQTYDSYGNILSDLTKVKPGESYKVQIKGEYFKPSEENGNEINLYIRIRTKLITKAFNGKEKVAYTSWGVGRVNYLNCELMELD